MALGAKAADVLRLVLCRALALTAVGIGTGLAAALLTTRVLRKLLFEVAPTDHATFISVALILIIVAVIASAVPARRAARMEPLLALHRE